MELHNLKPNHGARRSPTRKGRGIGSGLGKTSGRGQKGQKARSGGGVRPGFEGGQMPLQRAVPKRGFTNIFAKKLVITSLDKLNKFEDGTIVTPELMKQERIISSVKDGVKVLGNGTLEKKLTVQAHAFSKSAVEKITAAGGKAEVI